MALDNEQPTERALSFARLPDGLDGWRVLALGAGDAGKGYLTGIGAGDFVAPAVPSEADGIEPASFDLVICSSELSVDLHPLALYAWLRKVAKPEGVLIAGSVVLTDPALSQYARFLSPRPGADDGRWIPGRLAFRWMVEVSGFGGVAWLDDGKGATGDEYAYLQARAADRTSALDLDRQPLGV